MNQQDLNQVFEDKGKEIGFYLEHLDMPLEVKQGFAEIIPTMEPDQIDEITETLRDSLITQVAIESTPEYQEQARKIDEETMKEIDAIINA